MSDNKVSAAESALAASINETEFLHVGRSVREIDIHVDHAIVKHFSEHLYSSPNKAIEELVTNSYDAAATRCHIYLPGKFAKDQVLVWDNGSSMDVDDIEAMWQIARSPKEDLGRERVITVGGHDRSVIGKFGIGKLASYTVGERISHLCKTSAGKYFAVSVDYRTFTDSVADDAIDSETESSGTVSAANQQRGSEVEDLNSVDGDTFEPIRSASDPGAAIRELTAEEAHGLVAQLLPVGEVSKIVASERHWTLAIIDELRPDKKLHQGRLKWVLGNGMPLRPDFKVWVDDEEVESRIEKNSALMWDLGESKVEESIKGQWDRAASKGAVAGVLQFPEPAVSQAAATEGNPGAPVPVVEFPNLGSVSAVVRIFDEALVVTRPEERSYGFFVMVRGRLVNPDDEKLFLNDPSYSAFYRSQFVICADKLDEELLADRESLRRDTPMARELSVLQKSLYLAARAEIDSRESDRTEADRLVSRLPVHSRELFRDPMSALFSRSDQQPTSDNLDDPVIERMNLGEDAPLSKVQDGSGHLIVNVGHPFYSAIQEQAGGGKRAASVMKAIDLLAISERLTEGFLFGRALPDAHVRDIVSWRDRLMRQLAFGYQQNPDDVILELKTASYDGDRRFEDAVTEMFRLMGFSATRDGASGRKDISVVAPIGPGHNSFIVEAKGSGGAVGNVTAAVAGAANHRDEVKGASHALIIAREFSGFKGSSEPAIIRECRAAQRVSLVTVDNLIEMYNALNEYSYPLSTVMDTFFELESPDEKSDRIANLNAPLADFDYGGVLVDIWEGQSGQAIQDKVAIRSLWQSRIEKKKGMTLPDFRARLMALATIAGNLVIVHADEDTVHIIQSPDFVVAEVARVVALSPDDVSEDE